MMKPLKIPATKITPEVIFDPQNNFFQIKGQSRPESVKDFFDPVLDWLDEFYEEIKAQTVPPIVFHFYFQYLNSSSFKYILDMMKKLTKFYNSGIPIEIIWQYDEDDDDIKEIGSDLFELTEIKLPFKYVPSSGSINNK